MAKVNNKEIYEVKEWLNDTPQNRSGLSALVSGGGVTVEQLNVTENGTYSEAGKAYSPVVVNVPSGSSDFSTATMTVNVTYPEESYTLFVSCNPNEQVATSLILVDNGLLIEYEIANTATEQFDVLLYNGEGKIRVFGSDISVSGNATLDDNLVTFTGDFTINATAAEP